MVKDRTEPMQLEADRDEEARTKIHSSHSHSHNLLPLRALVAHFLVAQSVIELINSLIH